MTRSSLLLCALLVSSLAVLHLAHAEKPEQEPPANAHGGNPNANPNAAANGGNPNPNSLKEKSNFGDCGGAKTCLGVEKLERLLKKTGLDTHKSVDELAQQLDQDDDLSFDMENEMLVHACKGSAVAASLRQQEQQAAQAGSDGVAAGGNRKLHAHAGCKHAHAHTTQPAHSHHHHRRALQQRNAPVIANAEIASGYQPSTVDLTTLTQAQAFTLHSRPTATRKVYLDFNGHTTTASAWNSIVNMSSIISPPFDKDGSPTTWSQQELSDIFAIWRSVSEDYSPFDVDITTEEPTAAVLTNGIRIVVGGSGLDWRGSAMGGTSYTPSFGASNEYYKPSFVFSNDLYNDVRYVAETIGHELGHVLGLSHDGDATNTYYSTSAWAPIMGYNFNAPVTQFSKGEYAGANNLEDDYAIMSGYLPWIAQEYGTTPATATALPLTKTVKTASVSGVIRGPTDADVFSFPIFRLGTISVQLQPVAPYSSSNNRSNLLATVQILVKTTTGFKVVAQASGQSNGQFAFTTTALNAAAGTYYASVTPAASNTAFSNYGNRGQFQLTIRTP